jgi:hypothetical protein
MKGGIMIRTIPNIMQAYGCSEETAGRYCDLRAEGYQQHQALLMAGLSDPPDVPDNGGMPMSSKEKQEAFRARNAMRGLTEVRGVYLPPAMHAELKAVAEKMRRRVSATVPRHSETDGANSGMDAE